MSTKSFAVKQFFPEDTKLNRKISVMKKAEQGQYVSHMTRAGGRKSACRHGASSGVFLGPMGGLSDGLGAG